ncbi:hypothetical protein BC939DRAFT_489642 [Gamsiella multidivaricata]|uniref:uncharacterized protein n=1 Tax=Gamsiella multidivaricata TaxID=101098 RepID=UPI00221ED012|nr:uncharacterized protein BC939DRAFT_489642 [Gamsiella multidivaricata]KAI7830657.1 hypothetical protein BC939DRAFT_489642 [Gamsiella multidivaricata]
MLVNTPPQSHFKVDRFDQGPIGSFTATRKSLLVVLFDSNSPTSYHRRTVSCLAVASPYVHYNDPAYYIANSRLYDTTEVAEGSASPVHQTRHVKRKSDGTISLEQLQKGLASASIANAGVTITETKEKSDAAASSPLSGKLAKPLSLTCIGSSNGNTFLACNPKQCTDLYFSNHCRRRPDSSWFQKLNVALPASTPRRSLLSDLLNNQGTPSRLEQAASRRRMLKSMRRYSVDASEMDFSFSRPSSRVTPMKGIPSEEETPMLIDSRREFKSTPTVRYLRNSCHATVKTKLQQSVYRTVARRGNDGEDTPDYFGAEDRVW